MFMVWAYDPNFKNITAEFVTVCFIQNHVRSISLIQSKFVPIPHHMHVRKYYY